MPKFIEIDNNIYMLSFGTKSLMLLSQKLNNNSQDLINFEFFLSLGDSVKTIEESNLLLKKAICQHGSSTIENLLKDTLNDSCGGVYTAFSQEDFKVLYIKAVGEIGLSISDFYQMSPKEIELAYQGYINKKQLEANAFLIALKKSQDENSDLFSFTQESEVNQSDLEEREKTFMILGI